MTACHGNRFSWLKKTVTGKNSQGVQVQRHRCEKHMCITLEFPRGFYNLSHIWSPQQPEADDTEAFHKWKNEPLEDSKGRTFMREKVPHPQREVRQRSSRRNFHHMVCSLVENKPQLGKDKLQSELAHTLPSAMRYVLSLLEFHFTEARKAWPALCTQLIHPHSLSPAFQVQWTDGPLEVKKGKIAFYSG